MSLWGEYKIPVIAITGPFGSGKTSWALDVDPVLKGAGEGRTLYFDLEGSAASYENQYAMDRVPMQEYMRNLTKGSAWSQAQLWKSFKELALKKAQSGKFTVMVIDTFSPFQDGAYESATGRDTMDKWANAKKDIETFLVNISAYVETVIIIVHLRSKKDNSKEKEPKGVDTIKQLASLLIYLHRDANSTVKVGGKDYPACPHFPYPSGIVMKQRLQVMLDEKDEFGAFRRRPLLPDRVPVCTPAALRKRYLTDAKAVVFTAEEQMPEQMPGFKDDLNDDDRLMIRSETALREAEAASAMVDLERQKHEDRQRDAFRKACTGYGLKTDAEIGAKLTELDLGRYTAERHDDILEALRLHYAETAHA